MDVGNGRYSLLEDALFLSFDSSTQSLQSTILDHNLRIISFKIIHFDSELSYYKMNDGVYRDPSGNGQVISPPLMWVEAQDLLLKKLKEANFEFGRIRAISGSGHEYRNVWHVNHEIMAMDNAKVEAMRLHKGGNETLKG
eukprot:Gb_02444 [translate_table: standard]